MPNIEGYLLGMHLENTYGPYVWGMNYVGGVCVSTSRHPLGQSSRHGLDLMVDLASRTAL
jgi:hypothetical protein